jgi:hypothetical protein
MYKMMEKLRQLKQKQCMLLYSTIATQRATTDMDVKDVLASGIHKLVKMEQIHTKILKTGPSGTQTCAPLAFSYKSWPNPIRAKQVSCHVGP